MSFKLLAGPDARVSMMSGVGASFNSFGVSFQMATTGHAAFGDTDETVRGTIRSGTGVVSGATASGAGYALGTAVMLSSAITPASITLTVDNTGGNVCSIGMTVVLTGINVAAGIGNFSQTSLGFRKSGSITETWITS